jgi:hypothetical protein
MSLVPNARRNSMPTLPRNRLIEYNLQGSQFIFAKTMPEIPHWYSLRSSWKDQFMFDKTVQYIRDHGEKEQFENKFYIYLWLGDYKYWTLDGLIDKILFINKAKI